MYKKPFFIGMFFPLLCLLCLAGVYFLPPVHERLAWRLDELLLRMRYTLHPPQKVVFVPEQSTSLPPPLVFSPTASSSPTATLPQATLPPTSTPMPTLTPTIPATPLPASLNLEGVVYENQHGRYNYCAPANLAMALSFWGWRGNQDVVGPVVKPDAKDKNVMPYEMVDYVNEHTELKAIWRAGGDIDLVMRFIAAGFPVLVEKGVYLRDLTGVVSWMGHYQVLTGYDQAEGVFIAQDSYVKPNHRVSFEDLIKGWRAFNYIYILIFPPDRVGEVMQLLGDDADEQTNFQHAAQKASDEIFKLSGIDQYFAWFNRGTSLVWLQDYMGAAAAYDASFALYPSIPEEERPWRMLWYQTGPYFAYYYSQRYYDVLYLADSTLNAMQGDRNLEESYYWRGMAKAALGDREGAIQDFLESLKYHPGFQPALYQLSLLGVNPP